MFAVPPGFGTRPAKEKKTSSIVKMGRVGMQCGFVDDRKRRRITAVLDLSTTKLPAESHAGLCFFKLLAHDRLTVNAQATFQKGFNTQ